MLKKQAKLPMAVLKEYPTLLLVYGGSQQGQDAGGYNHGPNSDQGYSPDNNSDIPSALQLSANEKVALNTYGRRNQHYKCVALNKTWVLDYATAGLYANPAFSGAIIVGHFFLPQPDCAGGRPTWKSKQDGSQVTGKAVVKIDDPQPSINI
jgi:Protein of unknown function (DUF3455)